MVEGQGGEGSVPGVIVQEYKGELRARGEG
jgi:hypothetical protein